MKFWKNFINILKEILENIKNLSHLAIKEANNQSYASNEEPILAVKNKPTEVIEPNPYRKKLIIQNIGLEPCYIKLDSRVSKDYFHFVLAPDTSPAFGNGGSVTLENWHGEVYAIAEKETKVSVMEY